MFPSVLSGGSLPVASSCILPVNQGKSFLLIQVNKTKPNLNVLGVELGIGKFMVFGVYLTWAFEAQATQRHGRPFLLTIQRHVMGICQDLVSAGKPHRERNGGRNVELSSIIMHLPNFASLKRKIGAQGKEPFELVAPYIDNDHIKIGLSRKTGPNLIQVLVVAVAFPV